MNRSFMQQHTGGWSDIKMGAFQTVVAADRWDDRLICNNNHNNRCDFTPSSTSRAANNNNNKNNKNSQPCPKQRRVRPLILGPDQLLFQPVAAC